MVISCKEVYANEIKMKTLFAILKLHLRRSIVGHHLLSWISEWQCIMTKQTTRQDSWYLTPPAMSLKSSMNAPISFCIITIPNSPVLDAETEKNTRVKVFLTPAVAVFTRTWSMENHFCSPCCYIERQNTIFLFRSPITAQTFAQFQALCLAL